MKNINKLFIILTIFFINITCVFASNKINSINIEVILDENGNGKITEFWDMHVDNKTEVYKSLTDLGNSKISNFKAYMDDEPFTSISSWNINASFDAKAYKNGINYVGNGVELCWGMSVYGNHIYKITYDVSNMVYNTEDAQVLYWRFIDNTQMDPTTKYYTVKVSGPSSYSDTLDVWGYGDGGGYAYVSDGSIYMSNADDGKLDSNEWVVLLAKFPLNTFLTSNKDSGYENFDDFYEKAEEGSTKYNNEEDIGDVALVIISTLFMFALPITIIVLALKSAIRYEKKPLVLKDILPYRDIPCGKDIVKAYFISNVYGLNKKKEDFFGALFLKWILDNKMSIVKQLIKGKEVIALQLQDNLAFDTEIEKKMYDYLIVASKDMLLEENELKKWCRNNYGKFFRLFDDLIKEEKEKLISEGHIYQDEKKKNVYHLDDTIYNEAVKLAGLKKFLQEFARMQEKQAIEVHMWKYYLIFASIFGMANEVSKQFKKLYPELLEEIEGNNSDSIFWSYIWINNITTTSVNAASSARSAAESYSSGGGGFSSFGGGGGSFGGGGGGCR